MADQTINPLIAESQNFITGSTRTEVALEFWKQNKLIIIGLLLIICVFVSGIVLISWRRPATTPKTTSDETIINEEPINASATPNPITTFDETIINKKPINASLSFQYRAITATICPYADKDTWIADTMCTFENIIQAENVHGYWTFEQKVENSFIKLDRNNIKMLKAFEGNFKINISMYRLIRGRYGFVSSLNDVPISPCIFEQLNEKFSSKTRFCKWVIPNSIRYIVDEKANYLLTTLSYSNVVKLSKGDIITLKIFGSDAFVVGNPTVSFSGIMFV